MAAAPIEQSTVFQLGRLISQTLATLEKECKEQSLSVPNLDSFGHIPENESFRASSIAAEAAKVVASACLQLAATLMSANEYTFSVAVGDYRSAAVRVCLDANIPEILREAGPKGLHIKEIAETSHLESNKLGRILRFLSTHYVFREVSPDVFTNNRNSGALDTGKSLEEILADPECKYDSTAIPALCSVSHIFSKSSIALWDILQTSPSLSTGTNPPLSMESTLPPRGHRTAFSIGMKTDLSFWELMDAPEHHFLRRRFGFAMKGMAAIQPEDVALRAFDWDTVSHDGLVVDVGGGIGIATMPLVTKYGNMRLVIQDLGECVKQGERFWNETYPKALHSGRVQFEVQDFRHPQPPRPDDVSVFFLKNVLHNWCTSDIIGVLKNLRDAASPTTRLVIVDGVLPYACRVPTSELDSGVELNKEAPKPLLANYGPVVDQFYWLDMTMMFLFDGQEPTAATFKEVLYASGWKFMRFKMLDPRNHFVQAVEAVPM